MNKFNFGPNDTAIQQWGCFDKWALSHLDAHQVVYAFSDGSQYTIYVTYSHHCFAKTVKGYNDHANLLFPHSKDPRHFHQERYQLSLYLPDIIPQLPELYTFLGGGGGYCSCKVLSHEGKEMDYLVVFKMFKSINKLRLHVTSAYPYQRGKTRKVGFEKIVKALHEGRKLPGSK
ncbi:heat-shock protein [Ketobacter sp. MCCC 1A13808]|uniref:heat-shock protein n=1 Tax=Ketobacter sp. MCCC 1A13808 TaxID=2602738 RepID=UPI0012EC88C5|nr:heat-shock protein [Ketobacter sp. MCCC 1A13808]MVF14810.1 heat-shock protein [Ketobacter sp. MCCC 1A13808]